MNNIKFWLSKLFRFGRFQLVSLLLSAIFILVTSGPIKILSVPGIDLFQKDSIVSCNKTENISNQELERCVCPAIFIMSVGFPIRANLTDACGVNDSINYIILALDFVLMSMIIYILIFTLTRKKLYVTTYKNIKIILLIAAIATVSTSVSANTLTKYSFNYDDYWQKWSESFPGCDAKISSTGFPLKLVVLQTTSCDLAYSNNTNLLWAMNGIIHFSFWAIIITLWKKFTFKQVTKN